MNVVFRYLHYIDLGKIVKSRKVNGARKKLCPLTRFKFFELVVLQVAITYNINSFLKVT